MTVTGWTPRPGGVHWRTSLTATSLLRLRDPGHDLLRRDRPVREIAEITDAHGIWLHVDGAFAGAAAICPEYRGMHEAGVADLHVQPHKWLFTNFDNRLWLRDREPLVRTLTVMPEYLRRGQ